MHDAFTKSPLFAIMISVHPLGHAADNVTTNAVAAANAAAAAALLVLLVQFQRRFK